MIDLKASYDIKVRIIDKIEFMLRTLDNVTVYKRHHELDTICEQLQIAKKLCDRAIEKYTGHKFLIPDGIRKTWNASSIKKDFERVEENIKMANEKLATCLHMLNAEDLRENKERINEIKQAQQNPDRGIYFDVGDINPPPPTFKLSAKVLANGLEISWEPLPGCSENETAVEKYELLYDKDQDERIMINDRKCTKVTITMSLIKPGRPYSMEIRGINKSGGKGKWSETIIATLSNPVPSKPPTPKITIINHETALVMVQTPTRSCDSESPVSDWLVEYTGSDTKWEKTESTANSETQEITVKGLDPEKVYHFRVCAVNAEGASQPSALVTKSTSNVDPMQPINLHLSSKISHSFLTINWQMPTGSQEYITHYEVRKRAERDFVHDNPKKVDKKDTSHKFENLKSKTQYSLSVRACNDNGTSKWVEISGETCSKTRDKTSALVAKLPISKKDAKNKGGACASVFYDNDNDKSNIDDCNIDAIEGDNEHSNNDESDQDKYHDALTSLPVAKYGGKMEGKTKGSASSASVSGDIMSDQNDKDKDKRDKDNSNTNTHSSSVDCMRDSTGKEFRRRFTESVVTSRPDKGTQ